MVVLCLIQYFCDRGGNGLWGLIDLLHDSLHRLSRDRVDFQLHFRGFGEELLVGEGSHESRAQCGDALGRYAWWRQDRSSYGLTRENELEHLLLLVVAG